MNSHDPVGYLRAFKKVSMRTLSLVLTALCAGAIIFSACKKSDSDTAPYGTLKVSFSNEADGKPIEIGPLSYTNAAGNAYGVDLLKYYVSNLTLVKADGGEVHFPTYNLIDAAQAWSQSFSVDSVPSGEYRALRFYLGIDSAHNHSATHTGALDPIHGMIWDWNTGYIFFKHEGSFRDTAGNTTQMLFHYGSDEALATIEIPLSSFRVDGSQKAISLGFNLNALYREPNRIDFNVDKIRMSGTAGDYFWQMALHGNFPNAFYLIKAE
jgi:hypothetical protein